MPIAHRVLWKEGLFITPHHFQQWDLYHETQAAYRQRYAQPNPWGVYSMEVDEGALARGVLQVKSFQGVLPSGVLITTPEIDPLPPSRDFNEEFDRKTDALDVYMGLPLRKTGWPNLEDGGDASESARYSSRSVKVDDENTGKHEHAILRSEHNLRVLLGPDRRDDFECIPIARVSRTQTGEFGFSPSFVPPVLRIGASPYLMESVNGDLMKRIGFRAGELAREFSSGGTDFRDINPANFRRFVQLTILNGVLPLLVHIDRAPSAAPESYYRVLVGLAGQLCSFRPDVQDPRDFPAYDHEHLGETFSALKRLLLALLEPMDKGLTRVPLTPTDEGHFKASLAIEGVFSQGTALILAVGWGDLTEQEAAAGLKRMVVASPAKITNLIAHGVSGLPIQLIEHLPQAITRKRNTFYFQLEDRGEHWDGLVEAGELALYLPVEARSCPLELYLVRGW